MSEYDKQAKDFADKCGLTMTATYLGHYPRFGNHITANYRITLSRPNHKPFGFDFSTSIHDSWRYREFGTMKVSQGLPPRIDMDKFFESYLKKPINSFKDMTLEQCKKSPSLYDILACLTKYDPGSFEEFCSDYGYSDDSISAEKTWRAVTEEWRGVYSLFRDVMEELQDIN